MSAHTVSDGGGHADPSRVADNPKKPPDRSAAPDVAPGEVDAQNGHRTPSGRVKAFWTGARRTVAALASPTKRGRAQPGASAGASTRPEPEGEQVLTTPDGKRRKLDKDDVWDGAPLVPEADMDDVVSDQDGESGDDEDVFANRPTIVPMVVPPQQPHVAELPSLPEDAEPMEEDADDEPTVTAANALAQDIADVCARITPRTLSSFWVRKEISNLLLHCRDVRARTLTGASLQFDFDAAPPGPQTSPPPKSQPSTDVRLLRLEEGIAKICSIIEGSSRSVHTAAPVTTPPKNTAEPTAPALTPADPSSYAAKASLQPAQALATTAKQTAATTLSKAEQRGRRYDEARAIFQLSSPLPRSERIERSKNIAADTEAVNLALIEECGSTDGPRVAGLSWSENGNLVLMAMDGSSGAQLALHGDTIAKAVGILCSFSARQDTPWHKVTLTRVPTVGPDGQMLSDADVQANLTRGNPRFAALALVDCLAPVHWLTSELARRTQPSASMVVCFVSKEDADAFLALNNRLYVFGHSCGTRKFDERNAEPMCSNCWTLKPKHRTSGCRSEARCRICAGKHHTDDHQCDKCAAERAASNGDEQMADDVTPRSSGPCEHIPVKCVNCGGAHTANDARCPHRRKIVGSNASAPPMSGIATQSKPSRRRGKRSPATGANAVKPTEQANPPGWADPEDGWPESLDYGAPDQTTPEEPAGSAPPAKSAGPANASQAQDAGPESSSAATGDGPQVLVIDNSPSVVTGAAKRAARIKLVKAAFESASDEDRRRWVSRANGNVEIAIELGLAHYQGKSAPGERKLNDLRTRWAALNAPPKATTATPPPALGALPAAAASKTSISFLVDSPNESA